MTFFAEFFISLQCRSKSVADMIKEAFGFSSW